MWVKEIDTVHTDTQFSNLLLHLNMWQNTFCLCVTQGHNLNLQAAITKREQKELSLFHGGKKKSQGKDKIWVCVVKKKLSWTWICQGLLWTASSAHTHTKINGEKNYQQTKPMITLYFKEKIVYKGNFIPRVGIEPLSYVLRLLHPESVVFYFFLKRQWV